MLMVTDPAVVVDWGVIRALPKNAALPGDASIILADTIICEIAGSDSPVNYARKFWDVLVATDASRLHVGHYWDHVSRQETVSDITLDLTAIINWELTTALREALALPAPDWVDRITSLSGSGEMVAYETRRRQFVAKCEAWTSWIRERNTRALNQMAGNVPDQHEWIRTPSQVTAFLVQDNPGRFDTPEWQAALSVFPDRLAAGRWGRILIWYALTRSLSPERDEHAFENDWDDAHYAFLASYTGRIIVNDKELKKLVVAVFPAVTMESWGPVS